MAMNLKIEIPRVPNFLKVTHGSRQEYLPLSAFSEEELLAIAKSWSDRLVKLAQTQIANMPKGEKENEHT